MTKVLLPILACIACAGCQTVYETAATQVGEASVVDSSGRVLGTARLHTLADEVTINVALQAAPGGVHAVHIHAVGSCTAPDFTSAGPHLNPQGRQHGSMNPAGQHLGDLPNVTIGTDGRGTMTAPLAGARETVLANIFDADGAAVVVHASPDDYRTDPAGGAGTRIACGVLRRQ